MSEYARIEIEEYCRKYPKTKKARFLMEMVTMSYDVECIPEEWQMIYLEELISKEKNPELREALEELDDYLCGY